MANIGLQYSKNTVNTPIKAWRLIATEAAINMIFKYTNYYGSFKEKYWEDILKFYLIDFISVIPIPSIIKCNY